MIGGPRKCGTGLIKDILHFHPSVFIIPKEVHYFDMEEIFEKGINGYCSTGYDRYILMDSYFKGDDWYKSQFKDAKSSQLAMEKTPNYFALAVVPKRLKDHNPKASVIFSFRDPFHRTVSDFVQRKANKLIPNNTKFEDVVLGKDGRVNAGEVTIRNSVYHVHLRIWLKHFDRDQILVINNEKLMCLSVR